MDLASNLGKEVKISRLYTEFALREMICISLIKIWKNIQFSQKTNEQICFYY